MGRNRLLVRLVRSRALLAALQHIVDPVILKGVRVGVKAFRLRDYLDFLVVVGRTAVRANDCLLEICVLEVGSGILDHGLIILPLLAVVFACLGRRLSLNNSRASLTNLLESSLLPTSSSLRLNRIKG